MTSNSKKSGFHSYPWWCPLFWHGMRFSHWLRLVYRNRFRIHPLRLPLAGAITFFTAGNSVLRMIQNLFCGRAVARTEIEQPPIFIIGHWRSGTTYLHELLALDDRLAAPNTYQCFAPNHFLITEWFVSRYLKIFLPKKRPQDNVIAGWDRPQEDEFALCNLGAPSPYLRMAFPNHPPVFEEYLDMEGVPEKDLEHWKQELTHFVRMVTYRNGRRIVLKSPPHTARIALLARMFPGARFIHIVRNPYELFPSTVRLWKSLDLVQGMQAPRNGEESEAQRRDFVFDTLARMYRAFDRQRPQIDPSQICELHYEDLVGDPLGQLQRIYRELDLDDFEPARAVFEQHLGDAKEYTPNRHELDEPTRAEIADRWADYIKTYGYEEK